jgi:hypothetical protein
MFDTEHIIISQSYAAPIEDVLSWEVLDVFFKSVANDARIINDLVYTADNTLRIEWSNEWSEIKNHFTFRIMPITAVPEEVFITRQAAYKERLSTWKSDMKFGNFRMVKRKPNVPNKGLLDRFSEQRIDEDESDSDYELKIITACRMAFETLGKHRQHQNLSQ